MSRFGAQAHGGLGALGGLSMQGAAETALLLRPPIRLSAPRSHASRLAPCRPASASRTVVVGAGPVGILTAAYLARRCGARKQPAA